MAAVVRGIVAFLYESPFLELEVYRLMTILESSSALADYGGTYEGDRRKVEVLRGWEYPEVSRIVVSLAAIIRAAMDADPGVYRGDFIELEVERHVGILRPDATQPRRRSPWSSGRRATRSSTPSALSLSERTAGRLPECCSCTAITGKRTGKLGWI